MKKIFFTLVLLAISYSSSFCVERKIVYIDGTRLMNESVEGKLFVDEFKKEMVEFQQSQQAAAKKIQDLESELTKKSAILNEEKLSEKQDELTQLKRSFEREWGQRGDKAMVLQTKIQRKQGIIGKKQLVVLEKIAKKQKWDLLLEKNSAGIIFASDAVNVTDIALKEINKDYAQDEGKDQIKKA